MRRLQILASEHMKMKLKRNRTGTSLMSRHMCAGASEAAGSFQGRGQSLVRGASAAAPRVEGTGVFATELRR